MNDNNKKLIFWHNAKPEDFINANILDWVEGVGDISTHYEKRFINVFGEMLKKQNSRMLSLEHPTKEEIIIIQKDIDSLPKCKECHEIVWCDGNCAFGSLKEQRDAFLNDIRVEAATQSRTDERNKLHSWIKETFWIRDEPQYTHEDWIKQILEHIEKEDGLK